MNIIDRGLLRVRHLVMAHQQLNDWGSLEEVGYFQMAFPLGTTSKPGEGHPGPTEHYVNGLLTFIAGQLATRLTHPAYKGSLIKPDKPGSPEVWQNDALVTRAEPPEMMLPPVEAPLFMHADFMPVSVTKNKKKFFSPQRGQKENVLQKLLFFY